MCGDFARRTAPAGALKTVRHGVGESNNLLPEGQGPRRPTGKQIGLFMEAGWLSPIIGGARPGLFERGACNMELWEKLYREACADVARMPTPELDAETRRIWILIGALSEAFWR